MMTLHKIRHFVYINTMVDVFNHSTVIAFKLQLKNTFKCVVPLQAKLRLTLNCFAPLLSLRRFDIP